jgi:hypothetical protein
VCWVADVPNRYKQGVRGARAQVSGAHTALTMVFDEVIRGMRGGAWVSASADGWFKELQGRRAQLDTISGDGVAACDHRLAVEPDTVAATDWRAAWKA